MKGLLLFHKKSKNTQMASKESISIHNVLEQRGNQIRDGLSKATASTGTPMKNLHGAAKKVAEISNIGGGSKATGGGGIDEGMKAMLQYTQANTARKIFQNGKKRQSLESVHPDKRG